MTDKAKEYIRNMVHAMIDDDPEAAREAAHDALKIKMQQAVGINQHSPEDDLADGEDDGEDFEDDNNE